MLVWFYADVYFHYAITWEVVGSVERWVYPAAAVFVLTLSVYWALFPPSKKTKAKPKAAYTDSSKKKKKIQPAAAPASAPARICGCLWASPPAHTAAVGFFLISSCI